MAEENTQKTVTVYSTPTCMYCKMAKEFFDDKGVVYTELNVAEDENARNKMIERSGQMGVPVIVVGSEVTVGFDEGRLAALLGL